MKDIRKLPYRPSPGLVPQELSGMTYKCPKCKSDVVIPWLEKMEYPKQPIEPNCGGGHWVPVSFPLTCNACGNLFQADLDTLKNESRWSLYGDEAGRYFNKPLGNTNEALSFFCITLVGIHTSKQDNLKRKINKIKRKIMPNCDPDSWTHHFTDIWSSAPGTGKYALRTKEAKIKHGKEFSKIIRWAQPELVVFNISGCIQVQKGSTKVDKKKRKASIKDLKQEIFSQAILTTLDQMRKHNKSVDWVFDNIKDTTSGAKTEGWAEECFLGLQYTRLFTKLSAGATVLSPKFVKPGSHYLLEVADFISYWVARDFEKSVQGLKTEIPSTLLGDVFYQGTIKNGDVLYEWSKGLPLKRFYGVQRQI